MVHFPVVLCNAERPLTAVLRTRILFGSSHPQSTYVCFYGQRQSTENTFIYLFIYLFYCFSGKNAVRVISLFLDSASLKVCDFTVLTHHVPMHLSFPICPVLHIVCLEEQPDTSTGLAISHVSVQRRTISQKCVGKTKRSTTSKSSA